MQAQPSCMQNPCSLSPQQRLKARAPEALVVMLKAAHLDTYISSVCHQKMAWELEAAAPKSCSIHAILQKNSCDLSNHSHLFPPHSEAEISVKSKRYCFKNNFVRVNEKSTCCSIWEPAFSLWNQRDRRTEYTAMSRQRFTVPCVCNVT